MLGWLFFVRARALLLGVFRCVDPGRPRYLLVPVLIGCAVLAGWQLRTAFIPVVGEHNWRQADTYSIAFNFVHESADFFHPRIDWSRGRSGVMGMEAPIYPFLCSLAMRAFGDAPAIARLVSWALFALGMAMAARSLRPRSKRSVAVGFVVMALSSPMMLFESRQIQPDAAMVAFLMIAAALFHESSKSNDPRGDRRAFAFGLGAYTIAVLTKSPALCVAPALWMLSWSAGPITGRRLLSRGLWFAVPLVSFAAWSAWSKHLDVTYAGGEAYFWTGFEWARVIADVQSQDLVRNVLLRILPGYAVSWVLFPAVLAGVVLAFERENRPVAIPMLLWLVIGAAFCVAFAGRVRTHWYYALIVAPPLAYLGAIALGRLFDLMRAIERPSFVSIWAAAFVLLALITSPLAGGPLRSLGGVPGASDFPSFTTWVGESGLLALAVFEAVAVAITFVPRFPYARATYVGLVVLGCGLALPRAWHDAREALLWRARAPEWSSVQADTTELRRAVDAVSTRGDLFVVDGDNPWYLHLALRKGWVHEAGELDRARLAGYAARGARFFIHFADHGETPPGVRGRRPIASGERWQLHCIDPRGCEPRVALNAR
jgi:4-amino-4-deoxy-L-arabinose transferase-like glycosyltransferase